MSIRYNSKGLGGRLGQPETIVNTPTARVTNPNVSYTTKQEYTPARKEAGKIPKWKKDLVESYKKLGLKPPGYIKKTRQQREQEIIDASLGTGADDGTKTEVESGSSNGWWEIYRKISYAIITQDDQYEKPEDWPDSTFGNNLPDPEEPWLEVERVHEIGYINDNKEIKREKFYVPLGESDGEITQHTLTGLAAIPADPAAPAPNRIPLSLFNSAEATAALAQAASETT